MEFYSVKLSPLQLTFKKVMISINKFHLTIAILVRSKT